jgi:hypothetical protein
LSWQAVVLVLGLAWAVVAFTAVVCWSAVGQARNRASENGSYPGVKR